MYTFFVVIPTINGEINGFPDVYTSFSDLKEKVDYECTVYAVDTVNQLISEVELC